MQYSSEPKVRRVEGSKKPQSKAKRLRKKVSKSSTEDFPCDYACKRSASPKGGSTDLDRVDKGNQETDMLLLNGLDTMTPVADNGNYCHNMIIIGRQRGGG